MRCNNEIFIEDRFLGLLYKMSMLYMNNASN
jgi:hypothetical protein